MNWPNRRIKDVADIIGQKSNDVDLPYIALDNIISWDAKFVPSESTSDGNSNFCKAGDVLFGKLRPYLAKGFIPSEDSICSPEFIVLRPISENNARFLLYYLLSPQYIHYIRNQVAGTKMPRTNSSQVGASHISIPQPEEQSAIAVYLERECGRIGREIELLERKADSYRRLRRAIINQAVTTTPSTHTFYRLKDIFELRNGYTPSKAVDEFWESGTIPWFRMEDIRKNGRILADSIQHITPSAVKSAGLFEANSFILATTATIGEHAWIIADSLTDYVGLKWMFYKFFHIDEYCKKGCRITTFAAVDMVELQNMPILLPPISEQREIAAYLDEKCGKIDAIVEKIETKIKCLKQLKRSLINETVTGQRAINTSISC